MPCSKIDLALGRMNPAYTFLMKSHPLDQGLPSFKNPKVASCVVEKDTAATISFGSLLHSYFGVFGCQENPTFPLFSKLFSIDFLEEKMD